MKSTKLKCAKRSEELKNGNYKLEDHAWIGQSSQIGIGSIFKYIGEDVQFDYPESKDPWYEILDYDVYNNHSSYRVHELDEFCKPMTLAKMKKKYGEGSYRVKEFIRLKDKYGCTYLEDLNPNDYVLIANLTYRYEAIGRREVRELVPRIDSNFTHYFLKFDKNGYRILKNKPENYDPEFDNSPTYDKLYEGEDIQYVGDWNVRNNYFQKSTEYNRLEKLANDTKFNYRKLPKLYSCFDTDTWSELHRYLTSFGMTEDQFNQLKSMIKPSSSYFYVISREIKEFCKPFNGAWDYVKKFVKDFGNQYIEAYINS